MYLRPRDSMREVQRQFFTTATNLEEFGRQSIGHVRC